MWARFKRWFYEWKLAIGITRFYDFSYQIVLKSHQMWLHSKGEYGRQLSFENQTLHEVNFKGTKLQKSSFLYADLSLSIFEQTRMEKCDFAGALMNNSSFPLTKMWFCDLSSAELRKVKTSLHVRNRQAEDLEALKEAGIFLWDIHDGLRAVGEYERALKLADFLVQHKIGRHAKEIKGGSDEIPDSGSGFDS